MTEVEQPSQNGIELTTEEDENNKARPADIEQDMREMERRKRVEAIMSSKLFREELERIVDSQIREGGASSGILQQLSDIVGVPTSRVANVFKSSNCVLPINDIRGIESMGYSKGEKILRCKLAATFRLLDVYGWTQGLGAQITARLKVDQELFLVNPYGLLYHEVTASSLNKVDMQANLIEQGTTNFGVNKNQFILHSVVHAARPDIRCAIYIGCNPVVAVSSLKVGLLPLTNDSVVLGEISTHQYTGSLADVEEREKLVRNLGPVSKVMLLTNYGALCCGETIEEAFFAAQHIVQACETQLKLLPMGIDNLVMIPEESRKTIYDAARRPPEDLAAAFEKKATLSEDASTDKEESSQAETTTTHRLLQQPKWRVGGAEFEALMRMLDNAGFRTGYIYRHPLIKSELPKPKNDVEVPPAVSSLGYLLEEEELYRQGIWKKGDWRKGGDRSRWLNSPNVYQKVEVLETGTPDPKKITKWVAEGSPTHSTPVRIEGALQFVPPGTNPKEFKKVQQLIKDNRRADKISAGPQSHILEGVTWDEANRIKDATVSSAGDHVVLMGAASKGIIQRGFQHNATVYKAPYAKNPFDNVTDDELNEYKRTVERKKNIHGEYTDTDFSESEALSSLQTSGAQQQNSSKTAVVSQSETEDASEHQVMRIETKQAPVPSQPEVVLSDALTSTSHTLLMLTHPQSNKSSNKITQNKVPFDPMTLARAVELSYMKTLSHKYDFLYKPRSFQTRPYFKTVNIYMIHKVEQSPQYNYPSKCQYLHINDVSSSEPKPYRTHSHYGFNCPKSQLTYLPTVSLFPPNLLAAKLQLRRQKIVEFITHSSVGQFVSVKEINLDRPTSSPVPLSTTHSANSVSLLMDDLSESMRSLLTPITASHIESDEEVALDRLQKTYTLNVHLPIRSRSFELLAKPESERAFNDSRAISVVAHKRPLSLIESPDSGKSVEISINIVIRNSENLNCFVAHEDEIRTQLERVIDDEISLISHQLQRDGSVIGSTCYRTTTEMHQNVLLLLEHELENLINLIIQANELHNRTILCECKAKISQITKDIRDCLGSESKAVI